MFMYCLKAQCSICGHVETYKMDEAESKTLEKYWCYGRQLGMIQDLFPKVPAWIRSGAIDRFSDGFCICHNCQEGHWH